MSKKRKTREQKIILQLKRKLAQQATKNIPLNIKFEPSQEAIPKPAKIAPQNEAVLKKTDFPIFSYDPRLIKKDLLKTLVFSLIIFSFEFVLYLKLK